MAITLEEVERLREKSGASYEACRDALERTDGDMLEALIYLERIGHSSTGRQGGSFNTKPKGSAVEDAKRAFTEPPPGGKRREPEWKDWAKDIWDTGVNLLRHSTANQLEVWRKGKLMTSVPVLILILLVILAFWITVPLILLGLFLGCRYRFVGPDLGRETINDAMGNVSDTVDDMVGQMKKEFHDSKEKAGQQAKRARAAAYKFEYKCDRAAKEAEHAVDKAASHIDKLAEDLDEMVRRFDGQDKK